MSQSTPPSSPPPSTKGKISRPPVPGSTPTAPEPAGDRPSIVIKDGLWTMDTPDAEKQAARGAQGGLLQADDPSDLDLDFALVNRSPSLSIPPMKKSLGVLLPLFSVRSRRSLGIGDFADLPLVGEMVKSAGMNTLALLPLNALAVGETSPYSSISSSALNPIYIAVDQLEDIPPSLFGSLLGRDGDAVKWHACTASRVDYPVVTAMKDRMLRSAFAHFWDSQWRSQSERAKDFERFIQSQSDWLIDFALYCAFKEAFGQQSWQLWPEGLASRDPSALASWHRRLEQQVHYHAYVQWIAHSQWAAARSSLRTLGIDLLGDMPFAVAKDSADVWAHSKTFLLGSELGAPPDGGFPDGQNWGLPLYDPTLLAEDKTYVLSRVRAMCASFERVRLDHLVGFFRMWAWRTDGTAGFVPESEADQRQLGRDWLVDVLAEGARHNSRFIAEDLGTIPDFVVESLSELHIPGYRVVMWQKEGERFRDPSIYPAQSIATFSTHDTITLREWWEGMRFQERKRALEDLPPMNAVADHNDVDWLGPSVHDALLASLYSAGSELALITIGDLFCSSDRINLPATVGAHNWSYRLPKPLEELTKDSWYAGRIESSNKLASQYRP